MALGGGTDEGRILLEPVVPPMTGWRLTGATGSKRDPAYPVVRLILVNAGEVMPELSAQGLADAPASFELTARLLIVTLPPGLLPAAPAKPAPFKGIAASSGLNGSSGRPSRSVGA